jgi:hypothetical protein
MLLLDKSGSMSNNMPGSIEQILVLAMFCRKVNIPFVVYGFGDSVSGFLADNNINTQDINYETLRERQKSFDVKVNDVNFSNVRLREYINSRMSNAEFSQSLRNLILLRKAFERNSEFYSNKNRITRPESEDLSNTPLTQAIIACGPLMKEFRKKHNLDLTSLVIIHDGDSDFTNSYKVKDEETSLNTGKECYAEKYFYFNERNIIVRDPSIGFEYSLRDEPDQSDTMLNMSLEWFKKYTDSKVFGFFLLPATRGSVKNILSNRYVSVDRVSLVERYRNRLTENNYDLFQNELASVVKKFKSEKFIASYPKGYDTFFFVAGGEELNTENEEIEIEGKVTASKLKSAFMKFTKKKAMNRVLVSQFITGIAA